MSHTPIPGEEFAPEILVCYIDEQTGPYFTPRGWDVPLHRRLDVRDPDDRRAIVSQAAVSLGATEDEAEEAVLTTYGGAWSLLVPLTSHGWRRIEFKALGEHPTRAHATAALCAEVWGPKGAS